MRKTIPILIFFLIILTSNYVQFTTADDDREWQVIDSGWFSFGNISGGYFNGSIFNRSIVPIFPPSEGKGIYILEKSNLTECENRLIFSLDLISTPVIGKEFEFGEYYLEGEKIVGVLFYIEEHLSNYPSSPKVVLNISSFDKNEIKTINLDLNKKFSEFDKPFLLDSSGLWEISIEFTVDNNDNNNFYVFENISKWKLYDNRNYLTFYLGDDSNLTFLNQYEKTIPVLSISELVGLQQMLLAKEQGEYLNDTANSLEDVTEKIGDYIKNAESGTWATWAVALATLALVIITLFLFKRERKISFASQDKTDIYDPLFDDIKEIRKWLNDFKCQFTRNATLKSWGRLKPSIQNRVHEDLKEKIMNFERYAREYDTLYAGAIENLKKIIYSVMKRYKLKKGVSHQETMQIRDRFENKLDKLSYEYRSDFFAGKLFSTGGRPRLRSVLSDLKNKSLTEQKLFNRILSSVNDDQVIKDFRAKNAELINHSKKFEEFLKKKIYKISKLEGRLKKI